MIGFVCVCVSVTIKISQKSYLGLNSRHIGYLQEYLKFNALFSLIRC